MVPEGWKEEKLGSLFTQRKEKGKPGLPTMSVTISSGLVRRETLERKMESNLAPEDHLLARKGDIAYNMMRMWQGASGLAEHDGIVSPAYVVLKPTAEIDSRFASYLFKLPRVVYLLWAYSYGITGDRLRLYYPDFALIPLAIPPVPEQIRIGRILKTWDEAIGATRELLEQSIVQKKGLLRSLLTGEKRLITNHPWREVPIGDLIEEVKRDVVWSDDNYYRLLSVRRASEGVFLREVLQGKDILTKNLREAHAGDFLISKMQVVHGAMGLVGQEHHRNHISGSYIAVVSKDPSSLDIEFFDWFCRQRRTYHTAYLCSYGVHIEKMTFNFKWFLKEKIRIPSDVSEQREIASVMHAAESECQKLESRLDNLLNEKKALMHELLTGKRRVKVDGDVDRIVEGVAAHGS